MNKRPKCAIKECENDAMVVMYDTAYCGACVAKMDRMSKEKQRKEMEEILK